MKHATVLNSDTGGFILTDSSIGTPFDARLMAALNVVFDPDGQTNAVAGYGGRNWADVVEEGRNTVKTIVDGKLIVVLAAEGYLYVTVQDEPLSETEKRRTVSTHRMRLSVPSGKLNLADGMYLFDEDGRDAYDVEDITLQAGVYDATVYALSPDPEVVPTVGVFGDDESPAVIVVLTKSDSKDSLPFREGLGVGVRLDMSCWPLTPISGAICSATVVKIDGDEVEAAINLTSHTTSGLARFTLPDGARLAKDDEVWILLERDEVDYWTASMIEADA